MTVMYSYVVILVTLRAVRDAAASNDHGAR